MSGKPSQTSGGLKVKPSTPSGEGVKPETQTPQAGGVRLEKVGELKQVLEKPNTRYTYAIVRAKRNVVISIVNRNGFLRVNIVTMTPRRPVSGFDVRQMKKVIKALTDLYDDLTHIDPNIDKPKTNVREY